MCILLIRCDRILSFQHPFADAFVQWVAFGILFYLACLMQIVYSAVDYSNSRQSWYLLLDIGIEIRSLSALETLIYVILLYFKWNFVVWCLSFCSTYLNFASRCSISFMFWSLSFHSPFQSLPIIFLYMLLYWAFCSFISDCLCSFLNSSLSSLSPSFCFLFCNCFIRLCYPYYLLPAEEGGAYGVLLASVTKELTLVKKSHLSANPVCTQFRLERIHRVAKL